MLNPKPSRGERRYILALINGEDLKTTPQAFSRIRTQVYRKGFVKWIERGRGEMSCGSDCVTELGREVVGKAKESS